MEQSCPKKNLVVCIAVSALLNLGIVVLAAQLSTPLLNFDSAADLDQEAKALYDQRGRRTGYRFQNCSGGSVNCHAKGNLAGL